MKCLVEIGNVIQVGATKGDVFYSEGSEESEVVVVPAPFCFQVEDWLLDGQILYGVYGPVIGEHPQFKGLTCNAISARHAANWFTNIKDVALLKIGPEVVFRDHQEQYKSPGGTKMYGYPDYSVFGTIELLNESDGSNSWMNCDLKRKLGERFLPSIPK